MHCHIFRLPNIPAVDHYLRVRSQEIDAYIMQIVRTTTATYVLCDCDTSELIARDLDWHLPFIESAQRYTLN